MGENKGDGFFSKIKKKIGGTLNPSYSSERRGFLKNTGILALSTAFLGACNGKGRSIEGIRHDEESPILEAGASSEQDAQKEIEPQTWTKELSSGEKMFFTHQGQEYSMPIQYGKKVDSHLIARCSTDDEGRVVLDCRELLQDEGRGTKRELTEVLGPELLMVTGNKEFMEKTGQKSVGVYSNPGPIKEWGSGQNVIPQNRIAEESLHNTFHVMRVTATGYDMQTGSGMREDSKDQGGYVGKINEGYAIVNFVEDKSGKQAMMVTGFVHDARVFQEA